MKKSIAEDQVLDLNRIDFERAGTGRKAGYKFKIELTDGRVGNVISGSPLAMHLAQVILEDEATLNTFKNNAFEQAKKFDIAKILPLYEKLYAKVISQYNLVLS